MTKFFAHNTKGKVLDATGLEKLIELCASNGSEEKPRFTKSEVLHEINEMGHEAGVMRLARTHDPDIYRCLLQEAGSKADSMDPKEQRQGNIRLALLSNSALAPDTLERQHFAIWLISKFESSCLKRAARTE